MEWMINLFMMEDEQRESAEMKPSMQRCNSWDLGLSSSFDSNGAVACSDILNMAVVAESMLWQRFGGDSMREVVGKSLWY